MPAKVRLPLPKPVPRLQFQRHLEAVRSSYPSNRIPLPHPVQPLHVYRHLLRASSYFPAICRPHIDDRIKSGFRRERERAYKGDIKILYASYRPAALEEEQFRRTKALEEGKRKVASLNAALSGDQLRFRRILWLCFGKLGKTRRELMASFVKKEPDAPMNSHELEERIREEAERRTKQEPRDAPPTPQAIEGNDPAPLAAQKLSPIEANWDLKKMTQYLKSQRAQENVVSAAIWPRGRLQPINPTASVPEQDGWGRLITAQRAAAHTRKWWKSAADKVMPPIHKGEWDLLRAVGSGDAPKSLWKMPPRRPIAVPVAQESDGLEGFNWAAYAALPIRQIEEPWSRNYTLLTGKTDDGPYSQTLTKVRRGSPFSNRKIRREFLKMWQASSYKEQADTGGKGSKPPKFVWGAASGVLPAASAAQQSIFEGVDSKGQPVRQK